jgi:branched-chain amino acid transport system substrate-binding protein
LALGVAAALPRTASAQQPTLRIGVLTDHSGPYKDFGGQGAVAAVRQAVRDFGDQGFSVEVVSADHQNKPDVGATVARQWCDTGGVDMLADLTTSSVALAVNGVVREKNKVLITASVGTTDLAGPQCSPNTVQWTFDVYMLPKATAVYADYVFGQQLARNAARFVTEQGGKVLGSTPYPFPGTTDFSSFLLQAKASGAKVLGFGMVGADLVNGIKQAREFGLNTTMRLAVLDMFISDVHGLGLNAAQGILLCSPFYWDLNDRTRAFTQRLLRDQQLRDYPGMGHAGCYAGTLHYLKAVAAVGPAQAKADGKAVVARMKAMPTDDDAFGPASIREDGRYMGPAYLFRVKSPAESKGARDYFALVDSLPANAIWRPLSEGGCPLVKQQ